MQPSGGQTTSPATRWYRTASFRVGLLVTIGVFAILTFLVEAAPSFPIDLQITLAIQSIQSPLFQGLMRLISWPGYLPQYVLIILLIAWTLYLYRLRWEAVTSILTDVSSGILNQLVKTIIQRPRPSGDIVDVFTMLESYSFPSGHVMFYISYFGFLWYLAFTLLKRSWQRSLLLAVIGGFILLVGVSRISLGQHWASDVLGAYLLGSLILAGIILLYHWGQERSLFRSAAVTHDSNEE